MVDESRYEFNSEHRVWTRKAEPLKPFAYNDGDSVEQYLLETIAGATDVRQGSRELANAIRDWPSLYHLSPLRANLLRPLAPLFSGSVLELGAGCGALTRYLGECGGDVVAVEGSLRRAGITAQRCRDLDSVAVVCDDLNAFESASRFDCVVLVGVLEYSRVFSSGVADPAGDLLRRCRELLNPGGTLLIAIENQLGIKYFAGAPEDHTGVPYLGVEDLYTDTSPVTWGRRELVSIVNSAGFGSVEVLYPFPDYKLPRIVLTDAFARSEVTEDLLPHAGAATHDALPYLRQFSEGAAWRTLVRNGLLCDLANSFLLVARTEGSGPPLDGVFIYATNRRRGFQCEKLLQDNGQQITLEKRLLYAGEQISSESFSWNSNGSNFTPGRLYSAGIHGIINRAGWTVESLASWLQPYGDFLKQIAAAERDGASLPGSYLDCTPHNLLITGTGELVPFDLEWHAAEDLPAGYVLFRGILHVLSSITAAAEPAPSVADTSFLYILRRIMEIFGSHLGEEEIREYSRREAAFQEFALGEPQQDTAAWAQVELRTRTVRPTAIAEKLHTLKQEQKRQLEALRQQHLRELEALKADHNRSMRQAREKMRDLALMLISAQSGGVQDA